MLRVACGFHVYQVLLLQGARAVVKKYDFLCWPRTASAEEPLPYIICPGQREYSPCTTRVQVRENIYLVPHVFRSERTFT